MRIAVVGASGATGRELVKQALERGHSVAAVARDPTRLDMAPSPALEIAQADVMNPASVISAVEGVDAVVSGLGIRKGDPAGTLTAGARAIAAAEPPRMVWLGALGAGSSTGKAGRVYGLIMRMVVGSELGDKAGADEAALEAGATLVHPGPLTIGR
jgi:putative NADH-flavin reductase